MRMTRVAIVLAVLLLPGLLLAPVWPLCGLGPGEDDVLYYFPARAFFHETVQSGAWPWLNPWTGLGRPVATDPQSALWYPFTWLFALLPPLTAYLISVWAHYALALWGTYRLLRSLTMGRHAALFGGIVFAFCGFMLAHRAHLSMQHAAAWTPWVLWRLRRYALTTSERGDHRAATDVSRLATAVVFIALQCFTGHVQIAALTALASLVVLLGERRPSNPAAGVRRMSVGLRWVIAWTCAAGVFAIQWLPTLSYVQLCTRAERTYTDFVENSWHAVSAVGFVLPMLFGQRTPNFFDQPYWGPSHQVEQFAYVGLLPLILAVLAVRAGWRADVRRRAWVVLAVVGVLLALGDAGPLCPLLYRIPGCGLFRCPARAMLLVNLALAVLAASVVDDLGPRLTPRRVRLRAIILSWTRRPVLITLLLVGIPLLLVAVAALALEPPYRAAAWHAVRPWSTAVVVPLIITVLSLITLGVVVRHWQRPGLRWLLSALVAVDLGIIGWTIDVPAHRRTPSDLLSPSGPSEWMTRVQSSPHRLWVLTGRQGYKPGEYIDPVDKAVANTNILRHIASLTGYGPLQPRVVAERFGFELWGETLVDSAQTLLADTRWMRLYNVGWVLLCDDTWPAPAGCDLVATTPAGWRLYRNPSAPGLAMFEDAAQVGAVRCVRDSPTELTVWADTWPSKAGATRAADGAPDESWPMLVLSHVALPGWTASLNDQLVPVETVDGTLLGVRVPPGKAVEVRWSYRPPGIVTGAAISAASVAVLVLSVVMIRVARRRSR